MPIYVVITKEIHIQERIIEAPSEKDAIECVADGEGMFIEESFEYSDTTDPDTWTIRLADTDEQEAWMDEK